MRLLPSNKIYEKKNILEKSRLTDVSILCKFLKCLLTIATLHNAQMQCDVIRFLKSFVSNQTFEIISILTYTYLPNSILYRPKGKITKTNEL